MLGPTPYFTIKRSCFMQKNPIQYNSYIPKKKKNVLMIFFLIICIVAFVEFIICIISINSKNTLEKKLDLLYVSTETNNTGFMNNDTDLISENIITEEITTEESTMAEEITTEILTTEEITTETSTTEEMTTEVPTVEEIIESQDYYYLFSGHMNKYNQHKLQDSINYYYLPEVRDIVLTQAYQSVSVSDESSYWQLMTSSYGGNIQMSITPIVEVMLEDDVITSLSAQLNGYGFSGAIEQGYSVSIHEVYFLSETNAICFEVDSTYIVIKTDGVWWIAGKQNSPQ